MTLTGSHFNNSRFPPKAAAAVAALVLLLNAPPADAQVPEPFQGTWHWVTSDADASTECRKDASDMEMPTDVKVSATKIEFWEAACVVRSVRPLRSTEPLKPLGAAQVQLECSGEGLRWNATENWALVDMAGKRSIIMMQLKSTKQREQARNLGNQTESVRVTVLFECKR